MTASGKGGDATHPARLGPLLHEFDFAAARLLARLRGPLVDSGNGTAIECASIQDNEYLWEPVERCWSVRRHIDGPGWAAATLVGSGEWGRDSSPPPHPWPPPFTTIAWRLSHLTEMLLLRADHTAGSHARTRDELVVAGTAAAAIDAFDEAARQWRTAVTTADDHALDAVGFSSYPYGSDPEVPFVEIVWWVNQEVLHHGAEIALLRDLYRDTSPIR